MKTKYYIAGEDINIGYLVIKRGKYVYKPKPEKIRPFIIELIKVLGEVGKIEGMAAESAKKGDKINIYLCE